MISNHVSLVWGYTEELKELAMVQKWIDEGRKEHADKPEVIEGLNEAQTNVIIKKVKLQDEMFEIQRSN